MSRGVYLDYAATSAVRPPEVVDAVARYLTDIGATPGRSGHGRAVEAGRLALRCRTLLAELLRIEGDPGRIAFQLNATHALNSALLGILGPGDRVVGTPYDHNAVRRPIASLGPLGVEASIVDVGEGGSLDLKHAEHLIRGEGRPAKLLVLPHASNVTGIVLPLADLTAMAHEYGTLVLVDVAQTAGHHPLDVAGSGADLVAFTGHKGLLGPQGIGGLWVREGVAVRPLLHGGTGGDSMPLEMPDAYPDHLEAGTQNAPGIAGLAAGVEWILRRGVSALHAVEIELRTRLLAGLDEIPGIEIRSERRPDGVGIVTLVHERYAPGELALRVERSHGIQGRAGLHCAPGAHGVIGTLATGAFRLSLGWASTAADVDAAIEAFRGLLPVPGTP
jgi:cysteine desulfurase / selenocysteine lyase